MSNLIGKWELVSTEGVEAYMIQKGVSEEWRQKAKALDLVGEVVEEITIEGNIWKVAVTIQGNEAYTRTVTLGEEKERTTTDGRAVKTKSILEGDKITTTEIGPKNDEIVHEIVGGNLHVTGTSGGVSFKRTLKRI